MISELDRHVMAGRLHDALVVARQLAPARVRQLLAHELMDSQEHGSKYAAFIEHYFYGCPSAFLKAEIAYQLADVLTLELVTTAGSYAAMAEMSAVSYQGLVDEMSDAIERGEGTWVTNPYAPLPAATHARWRTYAEQLRGMRFSPTVEEGREHEAAAVEAVSDGNDAWAMSPRQQRRRDEGRSIFDVAGDSPVDSASEPVTSRATTDGVQPDERRRAGGE